MKIYHVSEEKNIVEFVPRIPTRDDIDKTPVVWAIDEKHLPNFLTPRDCPRVCFMKNSNTSKKDIDLYMDNNENHIVVIEEGWKDTLSNTTLYLYEFDPKDFFLFDNVAGYFVSKKIVKPINKVVMNDLISEFNKRNVTLKFEKKLLPLANKIKVSSFDFSLCRMKYAIK